MKEKDYAKTNRIMAEFIGYLEKNNELFVEDRDDINPILKHKFFLRDAEFHWNWNWLMKIVEKIGEHPNVDSFSIVTGCGSDVCFKALEIGRVPNCWNGESENKVLINCVYDSCVKFILWYNNNENK